MISFKDKYFQKKSRPDLSQPPIYGVAQLQIPKEDINNMLEEIEPLSKTLAKGITTFPEEQHMRSVKNAQINTDGFVGNVLREVAIKFNQSFNYKVDDISQVEYMEYGKGDFYNMHSDVSDGLSAKRKISISLILNVGEFVGGDLAFKQGDDEVAVDLRHFNCFGFTSFLQHRVTPITSGRRKVVVAWVTGEEWR